MWLYLGGVSEPPRAAQRRPGIVRHRALCRSHSIITALRGFRFRQRQRHTTGELSAFAALLRSELHAAADLIEPAHGLPELRARITGGTMTDTAVTPSHTCPAAPCARQVPDKWLMCPPHWAMVPAAFKAPVYSALRNHGVGSAQLRAAHRAAIDAVNLQLEEATDA